MDIRFFARKGFVYVSALAVASLISFGAVAATRRLSGHTVEDIPITAAVALALVIAICFQPLKGWIQRSLNRYVYRETYDYQRTVRSITRQLATILDLNSLLVFLTHAIHRTFKCEKVAIYLPDTTQSEFTAKTAISDSHTPEVDAAPLPFTSSLLTYLESRRRHLLADDPPRDWHAREAVSELKQRGGELVIPFLEDGAVSGILLIGRKLSGDPYLADDLDLLSILVGQAAIAIKNAYLYREVVIANERIENIVETMESGVVAIAANSVVTLFNSAAERITGLAVGPLKGAHVKHLPHALAEPIAATLADREPRLQIETLLPDGAGRLVPIIYSTSILKDRSGVPFGVVAVFSDLTKVRELEAEKRRTERLASIGAFASGIAHEIKNPLVAIKTFAELLPERFTEEEFRNDFSRVAIREIERIDELVGRLRGLVTSQPQQLNPLSVRELVDETLALLRGQLEQSQISVSLQDDTAELMIAGDRGQIKQLLLNIFINAIEAMLAGGALSIGLSQIDRRGGGQILVLVSDTGPGIPDDMLARLFDPFVTTKPRGSGLGLSICRGIVEAHRGTIRVQNHPSARGAIIVIELPIHRSHLDRSIPPVDEDTHLFSRPGNPAGR
ncbi:MAG: ATP-binding protein [Longimicrobiales bacterium]